MRFAIIFVSAIGGSVASPDTAANLQLHDRARSFSIAAPNSLLLVMNGGRVQIPKSIDGKLAVSTPSCIAVGTLSAAEGEASVTLTDENVHILQPELRKVFSGILATPKKQVQVCTVLLQPVLSMAVPGAQSNVEIWANHEIEPQKLVVLVYPVAS